MQPLEFGENPQPRAAKLSTKRVVGYSLVQSGSISIPAAAAAAARCLALYWRRGKQKEAVMALISCTLSLSLSRVTLVAPLLSSPPPPLCNNNGHGAVRVQNAFNGKFSQCFKGMLTTVIIPTDDNVFVK